MEDEMIGEEGCLSIPEVFAEIKRAKLIEVKGVDLNGRPLRFEAEGFLARAFQHELDHLDGITFLDRLSALKRRLALRAYNRERRSRQADERYDALDLFRR